MIAAAVSNTLEGAPDFFVINMTAASVVNETQISIQYRGKANPPLTGHLSVYEFSLNNITWYPMTVTEDSEINVLDVTTSWRDFHLTWEAMADMYDMLPDLSSDPEVITKSFYNTNIWIRFKATSGNRETFLISYRVYFKSPITQSGKDPSNNHIDLNGSNLLEQAPEVY
jgi:hypothetical protein